MELTHLFEVVDATDDEMYYPIGIWLTLEEAKAKMGSLKNPDEVSDGWNDEYRRFEVRQRKVGFSDQGQCVAVFEWDCFYNKKIDEYIWRFRTAAPGAAEEDE